MGNSSSKTTPEPSHIWEAKTPVRFSQNIVDHLESSAETNLTRAKTLELHIQARVAEELKRLHERETQTFDALSAQLSSEGLSPAPASASAPSAEALSSESSKAPLDRESVQAEIDNLKRKLEARKQVKEMSQLDADVEAAREGVIQCLRAHDRRPLDCWKEVAAFKDVVGRVEDRWVEKVAR